MAILLNIETSTDICSVCVAKDANILSIRETERSFSHSEVIAVFIRDCIEEAGLNMTDLDAVAIAEGPGSYTALRIGTATAKGICFALNIPLIKVGTLQALSMQVTTDSKDAVIIPLIDARRMEVYAQAFNSNHAQISETKPIILDDQSFLEYAERSEVIFCGDGAEKTKSLLSLQNSRYEDHLCSSKSMVILAQEKFDKKSFEDIAYYEPLYYKAPNINVQKKNILRS